MIYPFVLGLTRKEIVLQRHTEELSEAEFLLSWRRLPATILPCWPAIGYFIACRVLLARIQVVCVPLCAYRADLRARFRNFLGREKIAHHDVAFFLKYGQCAFQVREGRVLDLALISRTLLLTDANALSHCWRA